MVSVIARARAWTGIRGCPGVSDPEQPISEAAHSGGETRLEDVPLAGLGRLREPQRVADNPVVLALDLLKPRRNHEQRLGLVEKVVARAARDGPVESQPLAGRQNLLDPDRRGLPSAVGEGRIGEALEVGTGIQQAVGMVDPETVDPPPPPPLQHQRVGLGEHLGVLGVQRDEVVHIEEPAVVDLPRRAAPVDQPVDLGIEQAAEPDAAVGSPRPGRGGLGQAAGDPRVAGQECTQGRQRLGRLLPAAGDGLGTGGEPARKSSQPSDDLAQRVTGHDGPDRARRRSARDPRKDARHGRRIERETVIEIPESRHSALEIERDLVPLQDPGAQVSEDGNQHPTPKLALGGPPVDVEPPREGRGRPVSQDILPRGVLRRGGHVVGDDIEHDAHAPCGEIPVQRLEVGLGAQLGIERVRIDDIVAVGAAPPRAEHRRAMEMADAQPAQVRNELADPGQRKAGVELQPVGGAELGHGLNAAPRNGGA